MIDSRAGYSTNTVLNPFNGTWDRTASSGFGLIVPMGQLQMLGDRVSADLTAGGIYGPYFDEKEALHGGFGLLNVRYRFNSTFSAGIESGGSTLMNGINRQLLWAQPVISWSPTLFSQVRLKAGSTFQKQEIKTEEELFTDQRRFDQYGIEFETWPGFNWQIRAGLYGNMDRPSENLSLQLQTDYLPDPKVRIGLRIHADRYQFTQTVEGTDGTGGSPVGTPGGSFVGGSDSGTTGTLDETDRILRTGVTLQYQLHRSLSVMMSADRMNFHSSMREESLHDYQLSAGIRYSFRPRFGNRAHAEPEWRQNGGQTLTLRLNYSGEGQLYITGDFNDWDRPGIPLTRQSSGRYVVQLSLNPGAYEYKILLIEGNEERWIELSDETYTVRDGFGGVNGMVFID
ncbi:MAG: glycogen-binding domain-containing protein [Balneolaceae bacterium]